MKRILGILASILIVVYITACSHNGEVNQPSITMMPTSPTVTPMGEVTAAHPTATYPPVAPTATLTPEPTAIPERSDNSKYTLKIDFDYQGMTADVTEFVEYRNPIDKPLSQLLFIVEPNKFPNGFDLRQASAQDSATSLIYQIQGNQLALDIEPALLAGESIQLAFQYVLNLPAIPPPSDIYKPQPYGYTDKQVNFVDWYLFLPPLSPEGEWTLHKPSYFGEYLVYPQADFKVELNVLNSGSRFIVAASSKNLRSVNNEYLYELNNARSFALSLSSYYEVSQMTVGEVTVSSYYFGIEKAAGEEALQATADALKLYSEVYGAYAHDTLGVVEADFLDGMEYDGIYFLSKGFYNLYDGSHKGYVTIIAVHETAHQWFYGLVGNDQALEPWLDEGFCTFSELLFYENYYPELVDWWWYYRVNVYEPVGMINLPVYDYTGFTPYRNAVYLRGAEFLVDLRSKLGNDAFYQDLQQYVRDNSGKIATAQVFMHEFGLNGGGGQELLNKYFK